MPSTPAAVQQDSSQQTEKDMTSELSAMTKDGKAPSGQIFHLPIPPNGQKTLEKEPTLQKFGITRLEKELRITYNGEHFYLILSSHPITDEQIKEMLFYADVMDYLNIKDCCEILDALGLDHLYEI